jgi:hypothetical protein
MGNENDSGLHSGPELDRRRAEEADYDKYILETRDSRLSPEELRRKAFLKKRDQ